MAIERTIYESINAALAGRSPKEVPASEVLDHPLVAEHFRAKEIDKARATFRDSAETLMADDLVRYFEKTIRRRSALQGHDVAESTVAQADRTFQISREPDQASVLPMPPSPSAKKEEKPKPQTVWERLKKIWK